MNSNAHLPTFGVGPLYVMIILAITGAGIFASRMGLLEGGHLSYLRLPMALLGIVLILFGIALWCRAAFVDKINEGISKNKLVTTGVYAYVRNPIYSAFLFLCTGLCLLEGNLWLLGLPPLFWLFLSLLMKATEEKWLLKQYGAAYLAYCQKVNRCIPCFFKARPRP